MKGTDEYTHATLLDPRYKKVFFRDPEKCEKAVKSLLSKLKDEVRNDEDFLLNDVPVAATDLPEVEAAELTIKNLMKKAVAANNNNERQVADEEDVFKNYLNSPVEEKKCLKFWKEYEKSANGCKIKFALSRLAKKFLTPPATSTDVERLFSVTGNILCDERNRMLPDNVEKLLFMRSNLENYNFQMYMFQHHFPPVF